MRVDLQISVIVPSYNRPDRLRRCLATLASQELPPLEVLVVVRADDVATRETIGETFQTLNVRTVLVDRPGVVAAMNAGLAATNANTDIIALCDDDVEAWPDWLARIAAHFQKDSDGRLGGVGGRDWQYKHDGPSGQLKLDDGQEDRVGILQWFGRTIGNHHHAAAGPPRNVDILKGANCAFRAAALRPIGFDQRMRGKGAEVHWELSLCLALRRGGFRLCFDPVLGVDHFPAARDDGDCRGAFNSMALRDAVHNETLVIMQHLSPMRRTVYLTWAAAVGTASAPGVIQIIRLILSGIGPSKAMSQWHACSLGRLSGLRSYLGWRFQLRSI